MITTEWRPVDPGRADDPYLRQYPRRPKRIRAEYWLERGYFDITARVQEKAHGRWREIQSGQLWDSLSECFPELEPYLKWDGFGAKRDPHYEGLEEIWSDVKEGTRSPDELAYRMRLGALPDDVMPPLDTPWEEVLAWLEARHPRLVETFRRDMRELGRMAGPGFRAGSPFEGPKAWFPEVR